MPRIRHVTIVRSSDRNSEFCPTETMYCPNVLATPVSVIVPMMMPTTAQATPTGSAVLAPSASESRHTANVSLPPATKRLARTSRIAATRITLMP